MCYSIHCPILLLPECRQHLLMVFIIEILQNLGEFIEREFFVKISFSDSADHISFVASSNEVKGEVGKLRGSRKQAPKRDFW